MKPKLLLFSRLEGNTDSGSDLEVLGLQYLILPFTLLGSGLGLAFLVLLCERMMEVPKPKLETNNKK